MFFICHFLPFCVILNNAIFLSVLDLDLCYILITHLNIHRLMNLVQRGLPEGVVVTDPLNTDSTFGNYQLLT
jgi:hypothetical protein